MQIEVDPLTAMVTLVASVVSLYFYIKSRKLTEQISSNKDKIDRSIFYFERNHIFEGRLDECEECLKFYGISIDNMRNDNVTHKQVSYMVQGMNLATAICGENDMSMDEYFEQSEYWQHFLSQPETKKVWSYAKYLISGETRCVVDCIINSIHKK